MEDGPPALASEEARKMEEEARKMREAIDACACVEVDVEVLSTGVRERISALAPGLHPLRGYAELVDGHPLLVFRLAMLLSDAERPFGFIPWAWDGFFGAALTLTFFDPNQATRVHLRPGEPVLDTLRNGEFLAVLVMASGRIVATYQTSFASSPAALTLLHEQLDNLAECKWRYDSPETYEIELQAEARKTWTHLEFTREERNAIEWMRWLKRVVRGDVTAAEQLLPELRDLDLQQLPEIMRRLVEAFVRTGSLADTVPAVHEVLVRKDLRSWIAAMETTAAEARWKPCHELASIAMRTYLQGPRATNLGRRLPFLNGRTGDLDYLELDLRSIERKIDFASFWGRQPPDLRFNWGLLIAGADVPVSPDIFGRQLAEFPRVENVEEAEASACALLAEAVAAKQWTIPPGACVQLEIGPFKHMEVTELEKDVGFVLRTEDGEFFVALVEPDKQFLGIEVYIPPEIDSQAADAVAAAMMILFAAVIRDFWVVEHRESVFRGVERERSPWRTSSPDGPRIVYLPRVRYSRNLDVHRCANELQVSARREHMVSAHLRKARSSSTVQVALARRYGFAVPTGYTFVRLHERGREKREVVYRSRSALRSLFAPDGDLDARAKVKWFEFERDVQTLLSELGFTVEHIAASRRGDRGIDVFARKGADLDEICWVIQCKCWSASRKVGPDVVRELVGALASYPAGTRGMVVTTSRFTSGAKAEAKTHNIRLMDGEEFLKRLQPTNAL